MKKNYFILLSTHIALACTAYGQVNTWQWAKSRNAPSYAIPQSTTDNENNIISGGTFDTDTYTVDLQTIVNSSPGFDKAFIIKYNTDGEALWLKSTNNTAPADFDYSRISQLVTDQQNNIYAIGTFRSYITFDDVTLSSANVTEESIFIYKFNSSGNVIWAKKISGDGSFYDSSYTTGAKIDSNGNLFICGKSQTQNLNFGNNVILTLSSFQDRFAAKFDADGNAVWAKKSYNISGPIDSAYPSIDVDADGNSYFVGAFSGTNQFENITLTNSNADYSNIFFAKYDPDGNLIFAKKIGDSSFSYARKIFLDNDNLYITGNFYNTFSFDDITLTSSGQSDIFIGKFNLDGEPVWLKKAGGNDFDYATAVKCDITGNTYISGTYNSANMTLDTQTLNNPVAGHTNSFVAKLNNLGDALWVEQLNGIDLYITNMNVDSNNNIYMNGTYNDDASFGNITFIDSEELKYFEAKLVQGNLASVAFSKNDFVIYPNPASNFLFINKIVPFDDNGFYITDMSGRITCCGTLQNAEININSLSAGIYILNMAGKAVKFIKE